VDVEALQGRRGARLAPGPPAAGEAVAARWRGLHGGERAREASVRVA
jgi:hypothetical protein